MPDTLWLSWNDTVHHVWDMKPHWVRVFTLAQWNGLTMQNFQRHSVRIHWQHAWNYHPTLCETGYPNWREEKQRGLERQRYPGYIIDGIYYDTETYKKYFKRIGARRLVPMTDKSEAAVPATLSILEAKVAGELPLYYAIAQQTGLLEDLICTWGEDRGNAIPSLAFHWLFDTSESVHEHGFGSSKILRINGQARGS